VKAITSRCVAECVSAEVAAAFTHSFESYLIPVSLGAELYERRFRAEHLDPFASRVYYCGESFAAVLLVTRRGLSSRVAALAVVPELRGRGLGRRIMEEALADARGRGDRAMSLEVIEGNESAIALYTRLGFSARRRLVGYLRAAEAGEADRRGADEALAEVDPLEFSRVVAQEGDDELPWMLMAETFAAATAPAKAYSLGGHAYALVRNAWAEPLPLSGLVVRRAERRRGWGRRMLKALAAIYPGRAWAIQPIVPEDLAPEFFACMGWGRQELTQIEMRAELS
jgi:ribosomal protein S18 acetylase RimI-like enzyme